LALLDLYRQGALRFNQVIALGDLQISWTGSETGEIETTDEFDIPVVLGQETANDDGIEEQRGN
jgi:segregation and condensation protein A